MTGFRYRYQCVDESDQHLHGRTSESRIELAPTSVPSRSAVEAQTHSRIANDSHNFVPFAHVLAAELFRRCVTYPREFSQTFWTPLEFCTKWSAIWARATMCPSRQVVAGLNLRSRFSSITTRPDCTPAPTRQLRDHRRSFHWAEATSWTLR